MTNDPHDPGSKNEASFMLAAEAAIQELRSQADEAAEAAGKAKTAADSAEKSRKIWRRLTIVLGAVVALLVIGSGVTGYFVNQTRNNTNDLRKQAISSCQSGNTFRTAQTQIWEKNFALQAQTSKETAVLLQQFIAALAKGDKATIAKIDTVVAKSAKLNAAETKEFLAFVHAVNAPRNCVKSFSPSSVNGFSPTSGLPKTSTAAVTWTVVQLKSWNGGCLTAASANAGTPISEAACGSAHNWVYGSNGQLSLQGHTNTAAGDSGGNLVLKAGGTAVVSDSVISNGPSGFTYDRLYFGVPNTYWHANGNGNNVTLIGNPGGSLAVYYAFLNGGLNAAVPGTVTA